MEFWFVLCFWMRLFGFVCLEFCFLVCFSLFALLVLVCVLLFVSVLLFFCVWCFWFVFLCFIWVGLFGFVLFVWSLLLVASVLLILYCFWWCLVWLLFDFNFILEIKCSCWSGDCDWRIVLQCESFFCKNGLWVSQKWHYPDAIYFDSWLVRFQILFVATECTSSICFIFSCLIIAFVEKKNIHISVLHSDFSLYWRLIMGEEELSGIERESEREMKRGRRQIDPP